MIAAGALSGGFSSAIAGGKFIDGFKQGVITSGLNHAMNHVVMELKSGEKEIAGGKYKSSKSENSTTEKWDIDISLQKEVDPVYTDDDTDCTFACAEMTESFYGGTRKLLDFKNMMNDTDGLQTKTQMASMYKKSGYLMSNSETAGKTLNQNIERVYKFMNGGKSTVQLIIKTDQYNHNVFVTRFRSSSDFSTYRIDFHNPSPHPDASSSITNGFQAEVQHIIRVVQFPTSK